jgi:hypothetical protein
MRISQTIAMQKVVGSSPISRFESPAIAGFFVSGAVFGATDDQADGRAAREVTVASTFLTT